MAYKAITKKRTRTDYLVVHCSASTEKQNIGVVDIDKWHRKQGWKCVGYHYVIRRDGTVEEGRDVDVVGAHVSGFNDVSVGICMVGGVDANDVTKAVNNFTQKQFDSLKELLIDLKILYPNAKIQGHNEFPGVKKACPCFPASKWAKEQGL